VQQRHERVGFHCDIARHDGVPAPVPVNRRQLLMAMALAPLATIRPRIAWTTPDTTVASKWGALPEPAHVKRVFAAGSPAAVLACVLAPDTLLGWPMRLEDNARALLPAPASGQPHLGRLSGRGSTVTTESLLALKPDLILDAGSVNATHLSGAERVWRQTGLPYVLIDGRLGDHARQLREAGRLLGAPERGESLAARTESIFELVNSVITAGDSVAPPRVYYARGPDGLETGLRGSINMEAIEFVGADNVAAPAGDGGLTQVSMEQILDWNPEVVLTQDGAFAQRMRDDRLWRSVSAVRSGRIHVAPVLPFGWLDGPPGVNRVVGLPWLLAHLYPGRHPALERARLQEQVADCFQQFYQHRLPAAVWDASGNGHA
jgi:iron complex transport system substrate-binding protein